MATSERNEDKAPLKLDGSFAAMFHEYNYSFTIPDAYGNYDSNPNSDGWNIILTPFYITTPGRIHMDTGFLRSVGQESDIWSNTVVNNVFPTVLQLYSSRVQPSSHGFKFWGYSLCSSEA